MERDFINSHFSAVYVYILNYFNPKKVLPFCPQAISKLGAVFVITHCFEIICDLCHLFGVIWKTQNPLKFRTQIDGKEREKIQKMNCARM